MYTLTQDLSDIANSLPIYHIHVTVFKKHRKTNTLQMYIHKLGKPLIRTNNEIVHTRKLLIYVRQVSN